MSKFPLVRISSQKHIEELRSGQLFLRHVTFYQRLESTDNARSDVFDGSIPFPDNGTLASIAKEDVKNGRIMNLTSYVACFYHFHCEKNGYFYVPEEDKPALREFKRDNNCFSSSAFYGSVHRALFPSGTIQNKLYICSAVLVYR